MSQLLANLDARIAASTDPVVRAELVAHRAANLARIGAFEEAAAAIAAVRSEFGDGRSTRVAIRLMLAEGLLHTYQELSDEGADRLKRAQALAIATRDRGLIAATSVWLAHVQSERSQFHGMARSIQSALLNASDDDAESLARAFMVLGNAYASCGESGKAQDAYKATHHFALKAGDQATIDAMIYNKAAFALAWARARACFGDVDTRLISRLKMEIASAKNYQGLTGISAVGNFVLLWDARLKLLAGEYRAAASSLSSVRHMSPFADYNFHQSLIDLEIAYCESRLGGEGWVTQDVKKALNADISALHTDEQLVGSWLKHELTSVNKDLGDQVALAARLTSSQIEFDRETAELSDALSILKDLPSSRAPESLRYGQSSPRGS